MLPKFLKIVVLLAMSSATLAWSQNPIPDLGLPKFNFPGDAEKDKVTISARIAPSVAGQPAQLQITADVIPDWHIYSITQGPKDPRTTKIDIVPSPDFHLSGPWVASPAAVDHHYEYWPGLTIEEHEGRVTWVAPIEATGTAALSTITVHGTVNGQVCAMQCVDFKSSFEAKLDANAARIAILQAPPSKTPPAASVAAIPLPPVDGEPKAHSVEWDKAAGYLMVAFVAGILLNIMPCVLPVIGLKIMSFVQQAGEERRRVFQLNLWYVAGLMSVFLALAALVTVAGMTWGEHFDRPGFGIAMAVLVFAFALSLLGVWEIPLPGFVGTSGANEIAQREGVAGAFAKGALATVLATPCTGPFMATMMNWTLRQGSTPLTFAIFGAMGLGMGAPYLVIGAYPALIRFLPKPGAWMETFKQLMGFVLLGTVVWIFFFLDPAYHVATLALMFGVWLACWWIGRTPYTADFLDKATSWGIGIAICAVVGFVGFRYLIDDSIAPGAVQVAGVNSTPEQRPVWEPYTRARLDQLRTEGVTVLVDFTAKWCGTCQANKLTALRTAETERQMRKDGIVGLVAIKSSRYPEVDQMMVDLGHVSKVIPFYAVFPGNGGNVITYNEGILLQSQLLDMFKQAGPSRQRPTDRTAMALP